MGLGLTGEFGFGEGAPRGLRPYRGKVYDIQLNFVVRLTRECLVAELCSHKPT